MSNPYVGEIRLFAGNFAPVDWFFCDGSLLPISQYSVLFDLVGTTYGGNGQNNFGLPDLRGRVPIHQGTSFQGNGYVMGQLLGSESVTLTQQQMPQHTHGLSGSSDAASLGTPGGAVLAATSANSYGPGPATSAMAPLAIGVTGGNLPHDNMAPYAALNYIISAFGIFPSQS